METVSIQDLEALASEGWISSRPHPSGELLIHNYTPKAQFERFWTPLTLLCRGLITDLEGKVIARPFPKFFNLGEYEEGVPNGDFEVYEKMDGSLGILYHHDGRPQIATRGSFTSPQAERANFILQERYGQAGFDPALTYLFEIIYPENRIVVDYGAKEDLVLLAVIETASGRELPLPEQFATPIVKRYSGVRLVYDLKTMAEDNREGFVVRFKSGLRIKVKFEEYVRLHRIMTQISARIIWEHLSEDRPFDELIANVPDELYQWIRRTSDEIMAQAQKIEDEAKAEYREFANRKEAAAYFTTCQHPPILFKMLDGRDYWPIIWKMVRPEHDTPFSSNHSEE